MADPRIQLYQTMSVMLGSGVPLLRTLEVASKSARGRCRRAMRRVLEEVRTGRPLSESMSVHRCFTPLDVTLVATGEETGQLAEVTAELGRWYEFTNRLRRTILSGIVYPALMIHMAAFIAPIVPVALNEFNWDGYLGGVLSILAIFYIPLAAVWAVLRFTPRRGPLRAALDGGLLLIPVLGTAIRRVALSRYCKVFAMMYGGGIPILKAARMAPDACGNVVMAQRFERAQAAIEAGGNMSDGFPPSLGGEFISIWQVGEETGDLDASAARLGNQYAEQSEHLFGLIAQMAPRILYLLICLFVGYQIIQGYMQILNRAVNF